MYFFEFVSVFFPLISAFVSSLALCPHHILYEQRVCKTSLFVFSVLSWNVQVDWLWPWASTPLTQTAGDEYHCPPTVVLCCMKWGPPTYLCCTKQGPPTFRAFQLCLRRPSTSTFQGTYPSKYCLSNRMDSESVSNVERYETNACPRT